MSRFLPHDTPVPCEAEKLRVERRPGPSKDTRLLSWGAWPEKLQGRKTVPDQAQNGLQDLLSRGAGVDHVTAGILHPLVGHLHPGMDRRKSHLVLAVVPAERPSASPTPSSAQPLALPTDDSQCILLNK